MGSGVTTGTNFPLKLNQQDFLSSNSPANLCRTPLILFYSLNFRRITIAITVRVVWLDQMGPPSISTANSISSASGSWFAPGKSAPSGASSECCCYSNGLSNGVDALR
ncbi:hypothetical protein PoB_004018100 [Plakobranchus ocellatus]|uniref:Uncharacterized protein n=1 Tax=Plakobranchus ocellatus TaxID=259542 RepID=A0AAV4AR99_9GAST|nr:hypothetical protein PoB_004018100 [Plakobranchus ocellatus]